MDAVGIGAGFSVGGTAGVSVAGAGSYVNNSVTNTVAATISSSTVTSGGDTRLTATDTAKDGVRINQTTGDLVIDKVANTNNFVDVQALGSILKAMGTQPVPPADINKPVITSKDLSLNAIKGSVGAKNGPLTVALTGDLVNVWATEGVAITSVDGPLHVTDRVTSLHNDIILTVNDTGATRSSQNFSLAESAFVQTGDGAITLTVANNVSLPKGSRLQAEGPVKIQTNDQNSTDVGGAGVVIDCKVSSKRNPLISTQAIGVSTVSSSRRLRLTRRPP